MIDYSSVNLEFPIKITKNKILPLDMNINIPKSEIQNFCQAFSDVMLDRGFYAGCEPHYKPEKCLCCYAWNVPFQNDARGLLLASWFEVGGHGLTNLRLCVSAGQGLEKEDCVVISESDFHYIMKNASDILEATFNVWKGDCKTWYICYPFQGPCYLKKEACEKDIALLPSCKANGMLITPLIYTQKAINSTIAERRANKDILLICSMLEVVSGNRIQKYDSGSAPNKKQHFFDEKPCNENVYSSLGSSVPNHEKIYDELYIDIDVYSKAVLEIISSGYLDENEQLANALLAYNDGVEIEVLHPILAGIAFFSALASMVTDRSCEGDVSCSKCGILKGFRHKLLGEVKLIMEYLRENVFQNRPWPEDDVRKHLMHFHKKMRSAFVHQAKCALQSERGSRGLDNCWPIGDGVLNNEIVRLESLHMVKHIAQLAILSWLERAHKSFTLLLKTKIEAFKVFRYLAIGNYNIGTTSTRMYVPRPSDLD